MQISVTGRNIELTEPLKNYAEEKVKRAKKYIHSIIDAHIILTVQKFRQIAEVTISGDGIKIHGEEESEDMYSSIDMVMDKIEAQARKHKEKIRRPKTKDSIREPGTESVTVAEEEI
jgi:putative sigma-54 modulation protein